MSRPISLKYQTIIFSIGFLLLFYKFAFFIGHNTVDIPFWDQWGLVHFIQNKNSFTEIFFYQHNEHRIGVPLFIIEGLAKLTNWSQITEIHFVSMIFLFSCLVALLIKFSYSKKIEITDLIFPLIFFNIFQFENIAWGFQIAFVFPLLMFMLALLCIRTIKKIPLQYSLLIVLSLCSAYSSLHGLFLPTTLIFFFIIDYFFIRKPKLKYFISALSLEIIIIISYFINYNKAFQTQLIHQFSLKIIRFFSLMVNHGFLFDKSSLYLNLIILLLVLAFLSLGLHQVIKNKSKFTLISILPIIFALQFAAAITYGRYTLGIDQAFASRYASFMILIPLGIYYLSLQLNRKTLIGALLFVFILFNSLFLDKPVRQYAQGMTSGKNKVLECYRFSTSVNYQDCFNVWALYPEAAPLNAKLPFVLKLKNIPIYPWQTQ